MSKKEALLAQIVAEPDDDAPRMVFADWCDDNGDPDRAEFIRAQLRLAGMPEWHPERLGLEERSRDLLAEHRAEWLAHLPGWARKMRLTFRRGFVGDVGTGPDELARHGDQLAKLVPLEAVTIVGADRSGQLAGVAALDRVRELNLTQLLLQGVAEQALFGALRSGRLRVLHGAFPALYSGWPGLSRLTSLHFKGYDYTDEGPRALLASPGLGALAALDLSHPDVGCDVLDALVECRLTGLRRLDLTLALAAEADRLASADWPALEELNLYVESGRRDREGDCGLLRAAWIPSLRCLQFGIPGAADKLAAADTSRLASLTLWNAEADAVRQLLRRGRLGGLTRLRLGSHGEGDGADLLSALLGSPHLAALNDLELNLRPTQPRPVGPLVGHAGAARLRSLGLRQFQLSQEGVAELARSRHLRPARLDLSDNDLGDRGLAELLRADWVPSLRELRLRSNDIGDDGAADLAGCAGLSRLRVLDLLSNRIGDAGARALAESPHLGRLLHLELVHDFSVATCDLLCERFGDALVLW